MLELRDGNGALIVANDNWKSTQEAAVEETGLAPNDDLEAAILADLGAGAYTAILSGVGGATGIGLSSRLNALLLVKDEFKTGA